MRIYRKNSIYIFFYSFLLMSSLFCNHFNDNTGAAHSIAVPDRAWTIMIYGDGDNNLEPYLLDDIDEMKSGFINNQGIDLIALVDRTPGYTGDRKTFGENFMDTRLYRITNNNIARLSGGGDFSEITLDSDYEANMGDAETLKKFVKFCKANYPAEQYALILWNHGGGVRESEQVFVMDNESGNSRAVCWDDTNDNDCLYMAEITDVLTQEESVDLLGFDACFMGSVEIAYQYRPGNGSFTAEVMVAAPALEWGHGWKYDNILRRLNIFGGNTGELDTVNGGLEINYNPASLSAIDLGKIIVEEQYDSTIDRNDQTLSCYDLSKVENVKKAIDAFAVNIAQNGIEDKPCFENIRGYGDLPDTVHYFNSASETDWIMWPFFDLYDLFARTNEDSNLEPYINDHALNIMKSVDDMVICSFGGKDFGDGFIDGKKGIYVFFPDGDRVYSWSSGPHPGEYRHWAFQWWYNAIEINPDSKEGYGKLAWCLNGASDSGIIENWFELLDSWYDDEDWNDYVP